MFSAAASEAGCERHEAGTRWWRRRRCEEAEGRRGRWTRENAEDGGRGTGSRCPSMNSVLPPLTSFYWQPRNMTRKLIRYGLLFSGFKLVAIFKKKNIKSIVDFRFHGDTRWSFPWMLCDQFLKCFHLAWAYCILHLLYRRRWWTKPWWRGWCRSLRRRRTRTRRCASSIRKCPKSASPDSHIWFIVV